MNQGRVRLSKSSVGAEEKTAVNRVIDAAYLGMGEEVRLFEEEIAAYIGGENRHVICVSTGTSALHMAAACLDLGSGDEVLLPSITFVACYQAVSATGAKPVACDVRPRDIFIDLADADRRLSPRTKAIMPVHYASSAVGLDQVYAFAAKHKLRVIEDAAHSFGGDRDGKKIGAEGDIVCFSFDGIKNITSGEGGALVTSDAALAQRLRDARLVGVEKDTEARYAARRSWTFDVHHQGFRYHMSNIMAALGRAQLGKLPDFARRRRVLASRYCKELAGLNGLTLLELDWDNIVPHIFVVRVGQGRRDALGDFLKKNEIETGFHYQPNHRLSFYKTAYELPASDRMGEELLTLPLHTELTEAEQDRVITSIKDFFEIRLMPKVSIIMNCYNGEDFVRQAIESVYAQSFQDWEIVFWDNCSTDSTGKIANSFDVKLRYFRAGKTTPLGEARNLAMKKAQGEWIGFLDHDDLCMPNRLERQMAAVSGGDYALCYAGMREVDPRGSYIRDVLPQHKSGNIFGELLTNCDANLQTTMINRGYMERYGLETSPSFMLFEDVNLFLKLAAVGPVCVVPEVLSVWRLLPTSLSETKKDRFPAEYSQLLDDVKCANPGIEQRYPEAFRHAEARALYYQARRDMEVGNHGNARAILAQIRNVRRAYLALYLLSFLPPLFQLAHARTVKAKLTNFFLGRGKAA